MPRIRTIKPELPQSESMGRVSRDARLTFVLLWTIADDEGRLRGNSRMLASLLFPYDDDAPALVESWLGELEREQCILRYSADGHSFVQICNWLRHQKIDHPTKSKLPPPGHNSLSLASPREASCLDQRTKEGKGKDISCGLAATTNQSFEPTAGGTAASPTSRPTALFPELDTHKANGSANDSEDGDATSEDDDEANGSEYPAQFEAFWETYPGRGGRKRGKRKCFGIWRQAIRAAERQSLIDAAKHYARSEEPLQGFARDPERFLRCAWWRDWIPALPTAPPVAVTPAPEVPHRIAKAKFT